MFYDFGESIITKVSNESTTKWLFPIQDDTNAASFLLIAFKVGKNLSFGMPTLILWQNRMEITGGFQSEEKITFKGEDRAVYHYKCAKEKFKNIGYNKKL